MTLQPIIEYPVQSLSSIHRRASYAVSLLLVADIDEDLTSGRHHYRNRAGGLLLALDQVVNAILADDLLTVGAEPELLAA